MCNFAWGDIFKGQVFPAHWTTKNSAYPFWPKNSENTVVTVVQARFQVLYPFCSGPTSSASNMRSLTIFFVKKYFFSVRWIEGVLIWQASFLLYKQTSFGALYWIPLTHYFFITKTKNPKTSTSSRRWWGPWTKVVPELKSQVHNGRNDVLGFHGSHR